jgi:hypothetical protein
METIQLCGVPRNTPKYPGDVSAFQVKQGFVPKPYHGRFGLIPVVTNPFSRGEAKELLNPQIFPG